ncbi:MAG: hypothetical protein DRN53_00800 [Thermoprotei archaeon]|nr:MAG: hypothetical protein DRN53_00800 [Thermoprotei archaeon]
MSVKLNLWTSRRMARIAILGALTGAFSFIPIPVMPGMTLDPVIPALAMTYYGAFEGYWCYVVGQLIRYITQSPSKLIVNPFDIFMGSPCAMIFCAWIIRKVRYPLNLIAGVLAAILFHAYTIFPYCVIVYGWELVSIVFPLQVLGALIVISVCFVVAFGGATYMWKARGEPIFPWRFIKPEERFSVANRTRILISTAFMILTSIIAYGICFTPYVSAEIAGPPYSPYRLWMDSWIRHPITLGIGWFFWEMYKRNGEWFKISE